MVEQIISTQKDSQELEVVTIRAAVIEDAIPLAGLSSQLGYPAMNQEMVRRLSLLLGFKDHRLIVACLDDGALIGWVHVFIAHRVQAESFAELGGFLVAEGHRNRGVGKRLLAAAEDWAIHCGFKTLRVRTRVTRRLTHSFYERNGFSRTKDQYVFDKVLE